MCVCRRDPFVRKDFENFGGTRLINFEASYSFRGGEALSPLSFLFNKIFDSYTSLENFSRRFRVTETVIWEKLSYLDDEIKKKKKNFEDLYIFAAGKLYPPSPFFFNKIFDAYISLENFHGVFEWSRQLFEGN